MSSGVTSNPDCGQKILQSRSIGWVDATFKVALAIIGCCALAGAGTLTGITGGGAIVGLSISVVILSVLGVIRSQNKAAKAMASLSIVIGIVATILGSLAIAGQVPLSAAGWGVIGPFIPFVLAYIIFLGVSLGSDLQICKIDKRFLECIN